MSVKSESCIQLKTLKYFISQLVFRRLFVSSPNLSDRYNSSFLILSLWWSHFMSIYVVQGSTFRVPEMLSSPRLVILVLVEKSSLRLISFHWPEVDRRIVSFPIGREDLLPSIMDFRDSIKVYIVDGKLKFYTIYGSLLVYWFYKNSLICHLCPSTN